MNFDFSLISVVANDEISLKAAKLFCDEIYIRTGARPELNTQSANTICFAVDNKSQSEDFDVRLSEHSITITAHRLRGLIYGYSLFLRKSVFESNKITLLEDISGHYSPEKEIRGHQIGYRDLNNTYDSWDEIQYRRYFSDLMMFGTNTYEGIPNGKEEQGCLMKMSGNEMLVKTSEICSELDLDVCVWHPTFKKESDSDIINSIKEIYSPMPKLDALFIPGGDPGDMEAEDLFERCRLIKSELTKYHPNAKLWVSAQAPHEYPDWGVKFKIEIAKEPDFIYGVIFGPNHAMTLPELRECVPEKYPLRFYPDVTHSVRCEYPVHFEKNDWHYALASTLGRESINPRPEEYAHLHAITKKYFCGSVSYSDGIHDDVNKTVFSALDFDSKQSIETIIEDYARAYIFEADYKKVSECIFALEDNWEGNPADNNGIEKVLNEMNELSEIYPKLLGNFRFMMCLFRGECDALVRRRFIFESELIKKAKAEIEEKNLESAAKILKTDFSEDYNNLRKKIDSHAQVLNQLIGIQLDVETYKGRSWERGCTLETIDRPITDRLFLLNRIKANKDADFIKKLIHKNDVKSDEIYFSFTLNTVYASGEQEGEYYMDFDGDTPVNDGSIPVSLLNAYDHYNFRYEAKLTDGKDYTLRIVYKDRNFSEQAVDFTLKINGEEIYHGVPYGGEKNTAFEESFLPQGYCAVEYKISATLIKNGIALIEIAEPTRGFMISEFYIKEN